MGHGTAAFWRSYKVNKAEAGGWDSVNNTTSARSRSDVGNDFEFSFSSFHLCYQRSVKMMLQPGPCHQMIQSPFLFMKIQSVLLIGGSGTAYIKENALFQSKYRFGSKLEQNIGEHFKK